MRPLPRKPVPPEILERVRDLLAGGGWTPKSVVMDACRPAGIDAIGEALKLAESDVGGFVCLPGEFTSPVAPDERLVNEGRPLIPAIVEAGNAWRVDHGLTPVGPKSWGGEPRPRKEGAKPCGRPRKAVEPSGQILLAI